MNREVEERIVAMYFDNEDFEKNAKTTIETLDQLKKGLDLEDAAEKGFKVFDKIGQTLNFDKANQGLQKMKNTLSGMGNVFKKVFKLGPLDDAFNAIKNFKNKYIDRVVGFDIANKLVSSVESAFRGLTIQPISAGWEQYQSKMDSVKTIMSSTGEDIETVEKHLKDMTEYANKTIYSLTDMTSNLGKFTNNGIELERATAAMEGIANATADAGQGAQSASMAMYNLSQAMGVGKMTAIDWKSLENANIATTKLKDTFLEMAAASGRLRKEVKEIGGKKVTSYFLDVDEDGKKLKESIELTSANFREYLSKGWLDKETMLRTFEIYSGKNIDVDILESWGITDKEEQQRLLQIGQEALEAATQVRTFSKMMDALKESVQSGWAESFEIIFGNMEQGTKLWTDMNEKIDAVLSASTKRRNEILKGWAEMTESGEEYWTRDENNNTIRSGAEGGRDILVKTVFEMMDVIKEFGEMATRAFKNVFGELDSKKLFDLTLKFRDFVQSLKDWLGDAKNSDSRISKIQKGLQGVFNIIKAGINILRSVANLLKRILKPVIDWAINAFADFGEFFNNAFGNMDIGHIIHKLGKGLKQIWDSIKTFFTGKTSDGSSPFATWVKNAWGSFKTIVSEWMSGVGLGGVVDAVSKAWHTVADWEGWQTIGKFFSDVWGWLEEHVGVVINWFTKPADDGQTGFIKFINDVSTEIQRIWGIIAEWPGWAEIGAFFSNVWDWIATKAQGVYNWFTMKEDGTDSGFTKFLNEVNKTITEAWKAVSEWPGWTELGKFFSDVWGWIETKATGVLNWFTEEKDGSSSGFTKFLTEVKNTIDSVWKEVSGWTGWSELGKFFSNVWDWIATKAAGVMNWFTEEKDGKKSGFTQFLTDVKETIDTVWHDIAEWPGWTEIGNFFSDVWAWISAKAEGVKNWFTMSEDGTSSGFTLFLSQVSETISSVWTSVAEWPGWEELGKFFSDVWGWINEKVAGVRDWFSMKDDGTKSGFSQFLTEVNTTITEVWTKLAEWKGWQAIANFFSDVWGWIETKATGVRNWFSMGDDGSDSGFVKFLKDTKETLVNTWTEISQWPGWKSIGKFFGDIFGWISDQLSGSDNVIETVGEAPKALEPTEESIGIFERIVDAIGKFFTSAKETLVNVTKSEELSKFLDGISSFFGGLMNIVGEIAGRLGGLLHGDMSLENIAVVAVPALILIISKIFDFVNNGRLAEINGTQNFAQRFLEITAGMFLMASAIALLTAIDQEKMLYAAGVVAVMGVIVAAIIHSFNKLQQTGLERDKITSKERILNNLISTLGKIGMVAVAMALLPNIIKTIGDVKRELSGADIGGDVLNIMLGVTAMIAGTSIALAAAQKIVGEKGLSPVATLKTVVSIVGALAVVVAAFIGAGGLVGWLKDLMGDDAIETVLRGINDLTRVFNAIGGAIGGFFASLFGGGTSEQKAQEANAATQSTIESLYGLSQAFDMEEIAGISRIVTLIKSLTADSEGLDASKLENFALAMQRIGAGIYEIAKYILEVKGPLSEIQDPDNLTTKKLKAFIAMTGEVIAAMAPLGNDDFSMSGMLAKLEKLAQPEALSKLVDNLNAIMTGLSNLDQPETGIQFDGLSIVSRLWTAIQEGLIDPKLPKFDATPVVDAIIEALQLGDSAIAQIVHNMVQNGLNLNKDPLQNGTEYKIGDETTEWISELMNNGGGINTNDLVNNFTKELYGDDGSSGLIGQINALGDQIPSMASLFEDKGWMDFKDPTTGEDIDLLASVQSHLDDLGTTLSSMDPLKITITPVLNFDSLTPEALQAELDQHGIPSNITFSTKGLRIDFTGLDSALNLEAIRQKLDSVVTAVGMNAYTTSNAISGLAGHMDGIANEVARLKLWLDTGVLVGQITPMIDVELQKRSSKTYRTGTAVRG